MQETFTVTLVEVISLTAKVRHLKFKRQDGAPLEFVPGQFVSFHFPGEDGKEIRRSYSLASIPGQTPYIELALGYVEGGRASEKLFALKPGDTLTMSGPYGRLILRDEKPKRYIMVATSTGVTPYRAMLPALAERLQQGDLQVVILLGVQKQEDALYKDDFLEYSQQCPQLDFRVCYSRETDKNQLASFEYLGYVQDQFAALAPNPQSDIVYLCGNPNMIDSAYESLKEKGFTAQQVRREKYVS
jgi:ferredoxin-NADP reductase